eukprot:1136235-Pelagomonas_calceolata.AAC.1
MAGSFVSNVPAFTSWHPQYQCLPFNNDTQDLECQVSVALDEYINLERQVRSGTLHTPIKEVGPLLFETFLPLPLWKKEKEKSTQPRGRVH